MKWMIVGMASAAILVAAASAGAAEPRRATQREPAARHETSEHQAQPRASHGARLGAERGRHEQEEGRHDRDDD